jgi:hypothetical protein
MKRLISRPDGGWVGIQNKQAICQSPRGTGGLCKCFDIRDIFNCWFSSSVSRHSRLWNNHLLSKEMFAP